MLELSQQRKILEGFLKEHDIEIRPGARLAHLGRKYRRHFPVIADEINPYPSPWTKRPVALLAERVQSIDPADYEAKNCDRPFKPKARKESKYSQFYRTPEWRRLRFSTLVRLGRACQCCGAIAADGVKIHVDHIKPIRRYWHLRLDPANLQILCATCNGGKGSRYENDFRGR